jgi:hypothetical protein
MNYRSRGGRHDRQQGADDETKEKIRYPFDASLYSAPLDRRNSLSLSIKYTQVFRDMRQ